MNQKKLRVGLLFGGKSAEHEVSLQSAKNVAIALDKDKYELSLIYIDKTGKWWLLKESELLTENNPADIALTQETTEAVALLPQSGGALTHLRTLSTFTKLDVVFPILHGPYGEDGTVQGLLKLSGVPFVGAGVLGSAVGMDKEVMKRLLREAGVPVAKFLVFKERDTLDLTTIATEMGLPLFVKPANLGSSIGVNKVTDEKSFTAAIKDAFSYDAKILIEECIVGRELECAVLGNDDPIASIVGEVIPTHEFYSYDAKYIDKNGATLAVPAQLADEISEQVRALAIQTFKTLYCADLGRVDFFLKADGSVLVNEINTIPGFTKISMYPRLWAASGVSYKELITRLIELAIERFERENKLKSNY